MLLCDGVVCWLVTTCRNNHYNLEHNCLLGVNSLSAQTRMNIYPFADFLQVKIFDDYAHYFTRISWSPQEPPGRSEGGRTPARILSYRSRGRPRLGGTAGTRSARPLCSLRRSTEIVSVLPPMMTSKVLGCRRRTTYGPLYGGESGDALVPFLTYT